MTKFPVQLFLMIVAALCAFTLPEAKSSVREAAQGIFMPVAYPIRIVGQAIGQRLAPPVEHDLLSPDKSRTADELKRQNAELVTTVLNLEAQIDDLKTKLAQYDQLRLTLRNVVTSAAVVEGSSSANRQMLTINTAGFKAIREEMPVVCPVGFVGKVYAVSTGNITSRVLLATDPLSHVGVRLYRIVRRPDGTLVSQRVEMPPLQVDGNLTGMVIAQLDPRAVRNVVQVGDMVLLDDGKMPAVVQGLRIGTVKSVTLPVTDALHASIAVEPVTDLASLKDVLVVNKAAK